MKLLVALVLSFGLLPTLHASVVTAVSDPWPPFITLDPNRPGIAVEIVDEALKTQGSVLDMTVVPWARALLMVRHGNADLLLPAWYTAGRSEYLLFSEPYLTNEVVIVKRATDDFEFSGLESLSGKTVGVVRGYNYGESFDKADNFDKAEVNDLVTNLKKLMRDRIDLTIGDKLAILATIEKYGLNRDNYQFSGLPVSYKTLHIASSKANPSSTALIQIFNRGLVEIKSNGTFIEVLTKYGAH
ncbi:transporter substrate-binding domain-containing protein [Vibrio sp. S4M6]|uniref:substrate-binding periplasmic protein n=1 Tax=Vibrio sinus TaxID=2946865 RepID=UPI00202A4C2F|nr:transporter substrate-binding domain-containing protein [Vibrio sinus]MCL9780276.1 transporter substrate-binding domain-containing protein [Vibrio sinus]